MKNKWILQSKNRIDADYRLFCIPYAGTGATMYRTWQQYFDNVEIVPVQLPGRENRISEALVNDIQILTGMIYEGIKEYLNKPFSIFGHSMGGMLAYELLLKIKREKGLLPDILFMSGSSIEKLEDKILVGRMDDEQLIDYLLKSGGTLEELIGYEEFRRSFFPIIRSDYQLVEGYNSSKEKLECKIRAFASHSDTEIYPQYTEAMYKYTDDFTITYFEGNHFFVGTSEDQVCNKIKNELDTVRNSR